MEKKSTTEPSTIFPSSPDWRCTRESDAEAVGVGVTVLLYDLKKNLSVCLNWKLSEKFLNGEKKAQTNDMHQRVMLMMFFSWIDKVFNDDIIHTENHQILRNILL